MNTRTTIRDVAKEANVSIATVSKALNGVDVVKASTKAKVIAAAKNLHYVPNLMGKELKKSRTKRIGFYTTSITGPYFSVLIESIAREVEKHGYALNVFISMEKEVVLTSILGGAVDGFIGFEDMLDEEDLEIIRNESVNAVFIDRNIQDHTFGSIVFNSNESAEYATSYLIAKGHRNIAFVKGFDGVYDSDERFKGYQQALRKAHIPLKPHYLIEGRFEENFAYQSTEKFLQKQKDLPTAFLAGNDLSVVGFDGIELLKYFRPFLTTIVNPIKEQGELATQHLVKLINGDVSGKSFVLNGRLVEGESVYQFNRNE
ncbi:LacI family transcriptional regulator [Enterococcus sp. ARL09-542]|uniref:LacI family DNA-binding transcriptional regulator n=1 Tax=Enterococcus sp. ARL09-542 TaxID=2233534 RepID=UPI0010C170AA|nr:LacI family DNA-binding transcriptional regulator [Enterococcus sp. ARL09-542]TKL05730.1 LacI family transcriptional regulator [Enterococcus sp. ARL09-542]